MCPEFIKDTTEVSSAVGNIVGDSQQVKNSAEDLRVRLLVLNQIVGKFKVSFLPVLTGTVE